MDNRHNGWAIVEKNIEPKNSTIKWEKADAVTAKKLVAASRKNSIPAWVVELLLLFPTVFLLFVLVFCVIKASKVSFPEAVVLYILGVFPACLFLSILVYKYSKARPYLHPEKQTEIWIFRTKCFRIGVSSSWNARRRQGYFAFFNSKARQLVC